MEVKRTTIKRAAFIVSGVIGLALVFVFQRVDLFAVMDTRTGPELTFIVNRILRIFFNDLSMLAILFGLFYNRQILKLAVAIQLIDLLVLFPLYLVFKLSIGGDAEISSPFLSQFHRLIVNPTLMILLIPALYYQKLTTSE